MKNKKLCALIGATALLANMLIFAVASADDAESSFTLNGGMLALVSIPNSFSLLPASGEPATVDTAAKNVFGTGTGLRMYDLRGTGATSNLTVTMTRYRNSTSAVYIEPTQTSLSTTPNAGWTNNLSNANVTGSSCSTAGYTYDSNYEAFVDANANQVGDANTLFSKDASQDPKYWDCTFGVRVRTEIPAYQPAYNYKATLTFSLS